MKKIVLEIEDRVFKDLQSSLGLAKIAETSGGIRDAALSKILAALEEGQSEVELKYRRTGE